MLFGKKALISIITFSLPVSVFAVEQPVFLSEIQIAGENADDEFIELFNPNDTPASLDGLVLCRKTSSGSFSQIKSFSSKDIVPGKGFFLFAHGESVFISIPPDASTKSSPLSAGNSLAIANSCSNGKPPLIILDSIAWGSGKIFDEKTTVVTSFPDSKSIVRNRETLAWSISDTPTPTNRDGKTLIQKEPDPKPEPKPAPSAIRINELFPNPEEKGEANEWIELFNAGSETIDLSHWQLSKKSARYTFPEGTMLPAGGFLVISRTESKLALKNSGEETLSLLDPSENIAHSISYTSTKEEASYNFFKNDVFRWSRILTPGSENAFNNAPEKKDSNIPKKAFKNIPAHFSAKGKDLDRESLKYVWNFGDGHKSYKKETTHTYEETGIFDGTLTITDGTEDSITSFSVKVESYEPPKIRIVSFEPNPKGRDTENETIELENRSKKRVNLLGWSVATGAKKLVNHPIRNDFWIEGKSKQLLTRDDAAFSLNNTKGKIELRAPNGETIQKIKYSFDESIKEGDVMKKEKGKKWTLVQETESKESETMDTEIENKKDSEENSIETKSRLEEDTEIIVSKRKERSPLLSSETDPDTEFGKLLSLGTGINTPSFFLISPTVAGTSDEMFQNKKDVPSETSDPSLFETVNETINRLLNNIDADTL